MKREPTIYRAGNLSSVKGIDHFFSSGIDRIDAENNAPAEENGFMDDLGGLCRVIDAEPQDLAFAKQVHGTDALLIEAVRDHLLGGFREADILASKAKRVFVCVKTADCCPILMSSDDGRAVAAIHAGWKGTFKGIVKTAVDLFAKKFFLDPRSIVMAVGPSIGKCCYHVDDERYSMFKKTYGDDEAILSIRDGKKYIDLPKLNISIAEKAGIPPQNIEDLSNCTSCGKGIFHSYRRDCGYLGRQISGIMIR